MKNGTARFDRTAFEGMALDWTAFGRVTPDEAALDRAARDSAARAAAIRAVPLIGTPSRQRVATTDEPSVARRTAVRGGVVCGRRAPVHRVAVAHSAAPVPKTIPSRRLRLTTRGRFVLIVLPVAAILSGALFGVAGGRHSTEHTTQAAYAH